MSAVVETFELTKEFHHPFFTWLVRARAVMDLNLSVGRGEVFGLLGPNGSGKTTTIKLMLGLLFPSRGQVAVFGKRPEDQQVKELVGFLPEESYLYRFLDAEETLDFYGRLFGLPRSERRRRTQALLEMVGLWRERHRPVAEFSKGMQRRIGIAQSLINDPELLILDEPTTGLDPIGTSEIKGLIQTLKDKGKTVIISSHLLADMEDVCDRVGILYGGRLRACGTIGELLHEKRLVQITAEMDDATVAEVTALIRRRRGEGARIDVSPPMQRLEDFFLHVVEDARSRKMETSGVDRSSGNLDFMTRAPEQGRDLIQRLAQSDTDGAAAGVEPEQDSRLVSPEPVGRKSVLESLARGAAEAEAPAAVREPRDRQEDGQDAGQKTGQEADRGLLDKLVDGDGD